MLVSADYSQVELRVLAHIAGEEVLKDIFRRGEDVHTATARRVFGVSPEQLDAGMRSKAKMVNYGIVYGLSAYGLADRLEIPQEEAQEFIDRYLERFPAVRAFIRTTIEQGDRARLRDDALRPPPPDPRAARPQLADAQARRAPRGQHGRSRARPPTSSRSRWSAATTRSKAAGLATRLILQIHDELLFEGPAEEAEQVARNRLQGDGPPLLTADPPLAVDAGIGPHWLEAK